MCECCGGDCRATIPYQYQWTNDYMTIKNSKEFHEVRKEQFEFQFPGFPGHSDQNSIKQKQEIPIDTACIKEQEE